MPKPRGKVPSYCLHKRSQQAVVRINGKDRYLGPYGSAASHERYERLIAEWRAGLIQQEQITGSRQIFGDLSINQLLLHWDRFAQSWYVKNGKTTHEYKEYRYALTYVQALYGNTPVREFGPLAIKSVQHSMVNDDLCRNVVNHRVNRIKHVMKWAVSEELIPPSVYEGLRTVAGLRFVRTEACETEPIKSVARHHVDATLPHVSPQIAAVIQLQLLTE